MRDPDAETWCDPDSGAPPRSWDDAIDADPDTEPAHVIRFGTHMHAEGVTPGHKNVDRTIGYITKYITKSAADCHTVTTDRQREHLERFWREPRVTPCSDRRANWLLYGIQPKKAHAKLRPGNRKGRVHQRSPLGIGGRRILVSRDWSGKNLADHRHDTRAWVRALLGVSAGVDHVPPSMSTNPGPRSRSPGKWSGPTIPTCHRCDIDCCGHSRNASNGATPSTRPRTARHNTIETVRQPTTTTTPGRRSTDEDHTSTQAPPTKAEPSAPNHRRGVRGTARPGILTARPVRGTDHPTGCRAAQQMAETRGVSRHVNRSTPQPTRHPGGRRLRSRAPAGPSIAATTVDNPNHGARPKSTHTFGNSWHPHPS